ncbi:MAG: HlyD family efflux transporter periplasmic adaptor subunit [Steroidobacteraceae bacterium]|jgi:membrane fusion protein, multidrug efflux system
MAEPNTLRSTPVTPLTGAPPPAPAAPPPSSAPAPPPGVAAAKRKRLFGILAASVLALAAITALWLWITSNQITTDNAYVDADLVQVTPLFGGPVAATYVSNTDLVKKGQLLVLLDDADARIALDQARADLGQVERKVRGYFASDVALGGQVNSREADIASANAKLASAKADFERARVDLERRQALAASGAVSGDELTQAQNAFATAQAGLQAAAAAREQTLAQRAAAIGQRSVNKALFEGAGVGDNPEVLAARARVEQAELNLRRTRIVAPVDGVIAKNAVQVGQQVQPGELLMSIVPLKAVYVSANYKEAQLRKVRVGQPALLTSDLYGGSVKYHGKVVGLGGGTGAAFALIPAQNATGNWIKVVQRLPVRIALDARELEAHPLRVGLSMNADIDVSKH